MSFLNYKMNNYLILYIDSFVFFFFWILFNYETDFGENQVLMWQRRWQSLKCLAQPRASVDSASLG